MHDSNGEVNLIATSRFSLRALLRARGMWALGDQGVVSLGNCLTAIALAATLEVSEFGIFILIFGVLIFLNSLHAALVSYPLSVRGAVLDEPALRRLSGNSLLLTGILALPLAAGGVIVVCLAGRPSLVPWVIGAMVLWQIQETLRRGIMAHLRHREALPGDAISYLGQAGLMWYLKARGLLTLETAFTAMAATSLLAIAVQAVQLRPVLGGSGQTREMIRDHWRLGRWVLLTNLITVVTVQAMPWTLRLFHDNPEVARFGILANVLGVSNPIIISMMGLVVPAVAASASSGSGQATRVGLNYARQAAVLLLPYYLVIAFFPEFLLRIFSGNTAVYVDLGMHLRLFALGYLLMFPAQVMQALLYGLGHSRSVFVAQGVFATATLVLSLPLAALFGLTGAVCGGILPPIAFLLASAVLLRRAQRPALPAMETRPVPSFGSAQPAGGIAA